MDYEKKKQEKFIYNNQVKYWKNRILKINYAMTLAVIFLIPNFSVSQSRYSHDDLYNIDRFIERADSLAMLSQTSFVINKFFKDDNAYKEKWNYLVSNGKIILFEVNYIIDSSEYAEVYYVDKNRLLCSEEYETVNYSYYEDELKWGGIYYFVSAVPKRVVTLGKKKTFGGVAQEELVYERFEKRYAELKKHLPMLPGSYKGEVYAK